jgi:uncharacterized membrane protein HdeD (DUF308 family)
MSTSEVHRGFESSAFQGAAGQMRGLRIALGVGTVVLGLVALFWPGVTLTVVAILFGIHLFVAGAMRMAGAVVFKGVEGWMRAILFLAGVLTLLAGVLCLRNPSLSLLTLVILISFGWLIDGVVELLAGTSQDESGARWLHVFSGIVSILGALLILFWPQIALLTFTVLGGWLLVIFGVMTAGSALREHRAVTHSESTQTGGSTTATA